MFKRHLIPARRAYMKVYMSKYYLEHKVMLKQRRMDYYHANKEKAYAYQKAKRKDDIQYKLALTLRGRLHSAVRKNKKIGSAIKDLGCSLGELKTYIEGQFKDGMTWSNWAHSGWHIDHKIPLVFFDLTDRKQLLQAVHYTNLQPLWAKANFSKGKKIPAYV